MTAQRTRFSFEADVSSTSICDCVHALDLPLDSTSRNLTRYALIELLMNAVRASAETGAADPVIAEIRRDREGVRATVTDSAGGFDLGCLPYDFSSDPETVDISSSAFEAYRKKHDNKRFGLGLLMVRRAVDWFELFFVDASGEPAPWRGKGSVQGTCARFSVHGNERAS